MDEVRAAIADLKFEVLPIDFRFHCTHAVFPVNGHNSMCYATSKIRAQIIAEALTKYGSNPIDQFLKMGGTINWYNDSKKFEARLPHKRETLHRESHSSESAILAVLDDYRARMIVEERIADEQ